MEMRKNAPEEEQNEGMYNLVEERPLTKKEKLFQFIKKLPNTIFNSVQGVVIILAFFVFLYLIFITPHQVDGISMDPTFKDNEFLIANKMIYRIKSPLQGEVVIFKFNETRDFIKRVIAVEGDSVQVQDGKLFVNGEYLNESEYLEPTVYTEQGAYISEGQTIIVPAGKVFVAGDNREHSSDSRTFGPIEVSQIKGRVWFVFYPFNSIRLIKTPSY